MQHEQLSRFALSVLKRFRDFFDVWVTRKVS
jgi:hypothetical protein